jgi:peptidylprolyl isomerase
MRIAVRLLVASTLFAFAPAFAQDAPKTQIPADTEIVTTASGMKYSILTPGKGGATCKAGDRAKVHYTGWLTDGTLFDSSKTRGQPFEVPVGQGRVIKGWDEALQLMTVGERVKLTLPPELAYGDRGVGAIPANATLIFEIELLDVVSMPQFPEAHADKTTTTATGLKYEVLAQGAGPQVETTKAVEFRYALWNTSKKLLDFGRNVKTTLDNVPYDFIKEGLPLMKQGSIYRFEVPPELCFKEVGNGPDLPPNSVTIWQVELLRVIEPAQIPPFAISPDDKTKTTASGLRYEVLREGTGAQAAPGKTVTVHYAGWHTDGKMFDASYSRNDPLVMRLPGNVIKGWNEGLLLMHEGSMYRFTVPANLGYGKAGKPPSIAGDETLIFVIEMLKVE